VTVSERGRGPGVCVRGSIKGVCWTENHPNTPNQEDGLAEKEYGGTPWQTKGRGQAKTEEKGKLKGQSSRRGLFQKECGDERGSQTCPKSTGYLRTDAKGVRDLYKR